MPRLGDGEERWSSTEGGILSKQVAFPFLQPSSGDVETRFRSISVYLRSPGPGPHYGQLLEELLADPTWGFMGV